MHPCCLGFLSLPLLPIWMNVSSVTPWLLDFHTVQLSGSSGFFLKNWSLSFWLFKEAKRIYLSLHLGQYYLTWLKKYFIYLFIFRERGKEGEREGNINQLPLAHPQPGTWPTTQARALTGNWTSDLSVHRLVLNPLSHTSWGTCSYFYQQDRKIPIPPYLILYIS